MDLSTALVSYYGNTNMALNEERGVRRCHTRF